MSYYLLLSMYKLTSSSEEELLRIIEDEDGNSFSGMHFPIGDIEKIKELFNLHHLNYPEIEAYNNPEEYSVYLFSSKNKKVLYRLYRVVSFEFQSEGVMQKMFQFTF